MAKIGDELSPGVWLLRRTRITKKGYRWHLKCACGHVWDVWQSCARTSSCPLCRKPDDGKRRADPSPAEIRTQAILIRIRNDAAGIVRGSGGGGIRDYQSHAEYGAQSQQYADTSFPDDTTEA